MRNGDPSAFGLLYERYKSGIYGYCLRLLRDKLKAEDISQEVFLKMYQGVSTLNNRSAFRPWLFIIARNTLLSTLKKTRPDVEVEEDDAIDYDTPLEKIIAENTKDTLGFLVASLKPMYREVILLREYEGLSYEEIAEIVGSSVSVVKARLLKSRRALVVLFHKNFKRDDVC